QAPLVVGDRIGAAWQETESLFQGLRQRHQLGDLPRGRVQLQDRSTQLPGVAVCSRHPEHPVAFGCRCPRRRVLPGVSYDLHRSVPTDGKEIEAVLADVFAEPIPFARPSLEEPDKVTELIRGALESGMLTNAGLVAQLEERVADY